MEIILHEVHGINRLELEELASLVGGIIINHGNKVNNLFISADSNILRIGSIEVI